MSSGTAISTNSAPRCKASKKFGLEKCYEKWTQLNVKKSLMYKEKKERKKKKKEEEDDALNLA